MQGEVFITPMDLNGQYLGPFRTNQVAFHITGGTLVGDVVDHLNGTYSQVFTYPGGSSVAVLPVVNGKHLTTIGEDKLKKPYGISFHMGNTIPIGSLGNQFDPDYSFGMDFSYRFTSKLSLLGLLGYNLFDSGSSSVSDTHLWNVSANLKYEFDTCELPSLLEPVFMTVLQSFPPGSVQPYINAGPGIYIPEHGSTEFGFNAGFGMDYSLSRDWTIGIGAEYHNVFTSGNDTQFFMPHIRLIYKF